MGGERMVYGEEKGHTAARGRASHTAVLRCGANLVWRLADALAKEHLPEVLRHLGALVALVCAVDGLARLAKVKAAGVVGEGEASGGDEGCKAETREGEDACDGERRWTHE